MDRDRSERRGWICGWLGDLEQSFALLVVELCAKRRAEGQRVLKIADQFGFYVDKDVHVGVGDDGDIDRRFWRGISDIGTRSSCSLHGSFENNTYPGYGSI